jgi:hypothetical protein
MRLGEELESRDELLVEHRHLAVKDERRAGQRRDRFGEIRKSGSVVDTLSAHKPHGAACLVGHHAPAVDFSS